MAYSALGKNTEAYALANGAVSESSMAIQNEINVMKEHANTAASDAREKLSDVYLGALVSNGIIIAISVTLLMVALYCVIRFVNRFLPRIRTSGTLSAELIKVKEI